MKVYVVTIENGPIWETYGVWLSKQSAAICLHAIFPHLPEGIEYYDIPDGMLVSEATSWQYDDVRIEEMEVQ